MSLQVFIETGCMGCLRAQEIAAEISRRFPLLVVKVIDIGSSQQDVPASVFAVPAYLLDGRTVSLGNPEVDELALLIQKSTSG